MTHTEATPRRPGLLSRGGWALTGRLLPQIYTIVTSIIVARSLGASSFGQVTFIAFIEVALISLLTLGMPVAVLRFVAEVIGAGEPDQARGLYVWALRVEAVGALVGVTALSAVAAFGGEPAAAWVLAGVACAAAVLQSVPAAVLIGMQRWREATIVGLSTGLVGMVAKAVVLTLGGGITGIFAVDAAIGIVNLVGTGFLATRAARGEAEHVERSPTLIRRTARFAAVGSIGTVISLVLWNRSELFFLGTLSSHAQIALYSVPFSFVVALALVPSAAAAILLPTIAKSIGEGSEDRVHEGFWTAIRVMLMLSFALVALAFAAGPQTIVALYGHAFEGSGVVLLILLAGYPALTLATLSGATLLGLGRQWVPTGITAFAACINLALDVILIARFDAVGAAVANATAQIVAGIPLAIYAARKVGGEADIRVAAMLRFAAAAALAGGAGAAVAWSLPPLPGVVVALVVSVAVGTVALRILRPVPRQDADWLAAVVGPRLGWLPRSLAR